MDHQSNQESNSHHNVNEEMAADFAYGLPVTHAVDERDPHVEQTVTVASESSALGWVSLIFAIASWFIWPVLIGSSAVILGFISYRQGSKGLGAWSMLMGIFAIVLQLVIVPFYYALI